MFLKLKTDFFIIKLYRAMQAPIIVTDAHRELIGFISLYEVEPYPGLIDVIERSNPLPSLAETLELIANTGKCIKSLDVKMNQLMSTNGNIKDILRLNTETQIYRNHEYKLIRIYNYMTLQLELKNTLTNAFSAEPKIDCPDEDPDEESDEDKPQNNREEPDEEIPPSNPRSNREESAIIEDNISEASEELFEPAPQNNTILIRSSGGYASIQRRPPVNDEIKNNDEETIIEID
jgi:hypothetical protein